MNSKSVAQIDEKTCIFSSKKPPPAWQRAGSSTCLIKFVAGARSAIPIATAQQKPCAQMPRTRLANFNRTAPFDFAERGG